MQRHTTFGRTFGNFLAGLVVSGASLAGAAVDMTATWRIDGTVGPVTILTYETIVQTGTTLELIRATDPPIVFPGTIDPETGAFQLSFGSATQSAVLGPGPEVIRQGTVAPDGLTYTAQQNLCIWDYEWACLTFDLAGTRTAITCGDGVVEGAEKCDLGAANGADCCTAVCALIDGDHDRVCNPLDNCPDYPNGWQEDFDGDGLGDPCDPEPDGPPAGPLALRGIRITSGAAAGTVSKLTADGDTPGPLGVPSGLRLTDAGGKTLDLGGLPLWNEKECDASPRRVRCSTPDRALKLIISSRRSDPQALGFRVRVAQPPLSPPFSAPVAFTIGLADGAHAGVLSNCKATTGGGIRCKR